MTIDAARQATAGPASRADEAPPIGEADANIFDCPVCRRPLAAGASRCPGCRTRLIAGVRATRASGFILVGLVAGLVLGGTAVGAVTTLTQASTTAGVTEAEPAAIPSAGTEAGRPVASAVPIPVSVGVPASAAAALRQSFLVNDRLAADAARLEAALGQSSAADIARSLRALAATAAFGDRIAPDVAGWADAAPVSSRLAAGYALVGATAREGLTASLTNRAAYLRAGRAMLDALAELATTDGEARALARSAGLIADAGPSAP